MTSKPGAFFLADLGITRSHSRPHVSNDNAFSEACSRRSSTVLNPRHGFCSIQDALVFRGSFFAWYNGQDRHSALSLLTRETVHNGRAEEVRDARQVVLADACAAHPERFVRKHPEPPPLPGPVWINPPKEVPHQ